MPPGIKTCPGTDPPGGHGSKEGLPVSVVKVAAQQVLPEDLGGGWGPLTPAHPQPGRDPAPGSALSCGSCEPHRPPVPLSWPLWHHSSLKADCWGRRLPRQRHSPPSSLSPASPPSPGSTEALAPFKVGRASVDDSPFDWLEASTSSPPLTDLPSSG